jgi:hypothetical protein
LAGGIERNVFGLSISAGKTSGRSAFGSAYPKTAKKLQTPPEGMPFSFSSVVAVFGLGAGNSEAWARYCDEAEVVSFPVEVRSA